MNKMMPTTLSAARGGIVAFADEGLVEDEDGGGGDDDPVKLSQLGGVGNRAIYDKSLERMMAIAEGNAGRKFKEFTPEDRAAARADSLKAQMSGVTADPYTPYGKSLDELDASRNKNLDQAKGLAALRAGSAMLQGNNAMRGLAGGASAFGESYGAAIQADQQQKQSLAQMRFHMAESQRKEQMGMSKEARADAALAQNARRDANNAENRKDAATGAIYRGIALASRPGRPAGGGRNDNSVNKNLFSAMNLAEKVDASIDRARKDPSYLTALEDVKLVPDTPAKKARVERAQKYITDTDTRLNTRKQRADDLIDQYQPGGKAAPKATPVATKTPDIASVAGAPKGSKIGKMVTGKGHEVIDASGKLIGYAQ